jgi:hypothetical protein
MPVFTIGGQLFTTATSVSTIVKTAGTSHSFSALYVLLFVVWQFNFKKTGFAANLY